MKYKWMQEPLREVVGYIAKGIPPAYVENESSSTIRVLNQKCNRDFTINYAESRLHNLVQRDVPQEKYLRNDDILINSTGTGTAGRVAQLLHVPCPTVIDGHMILIRPNDKIISRYLGYAIKAHQKEILQLDEGSTGQTELNRERLLSEILISYPQSLALQKDIADTFSALDARIVENKKINHHLEQMAQTIFKSWFDCYDPSQPFTNAVQVLGGGTPKTGNESYWNGEIPFFTPKDTGSLYVLSTEKRLSEAGLSNCNSRLYPVNTVFVTARGTVGKLALAGCPMAMNQSCYALVSNGDYGQFYVYHLALTVVEKLKRKANGAVFDAIVTRDFENELVPAPATREIKAFEDKIQPIFETILNNCKENVRLAELRDTLLPRLMSGELSVADLGDGK